MGIELQQPVFWIIIFAAMVVLELLTMGLTSIWFAGGALVALFVSMTKVGPGTDAVVSGSFICSSDPGAAMGQKAL